MSRACTCAASATLALKEWNRCAITPRSFIRITRGCENRKELNSFKLLYYRRSCFSKYSKAAYTFYLRQPGKLFDCYSCAAAHAFVCDRAVSTGSLHSLSPLSLG